MLHFREFEAGPDPFGRKFQVMFQWLQTAISLRNADSIDVKFLLVDESGARTAKTIALPHPGVNRAAAGIGRAVDDAWCARLAELAKTWRRTWLRSPPRTSAATPPSWRAWSAAKRAEP